MAHPGSIRCLRVAIAVLAVGLASCVYVPPLGDQFTEQEQASIVVGKTTRAEVDAMLGEPDLLAAPGTAVYRLGRSSGTVLFVFGAGYSGGIGAIPLDHQSFRVLVHFDEHDRVDRYEVEAMGHHLLGSSQEGAPFRSPAGTGRKLLFVGRGRDLFGCATGVAFTSVAYSRGGDRIAAGGHKLVGGNPSSKRVWIHECAGGDTRRVPAPDYATLWFGPDLRTFAAMKRTVSVVDIASGAVRTVFRGHGDAYFWSQRGASALAYSPEGDEIATGGVKGRVRIWNVDSGRERLAIRAHEGGVLAVAWSADGKWLATSGYEGRVRVWDARQGHAILELGGGRRSRALTLAFSPRGDLLATGQETHLELWRLAAGDPATLADVVLLPYLGTGFPLPQSLAFSAKGDLLAIGRGYLVMYDVDQQRVVARVKPEEEHLAGGSVENDAVLALAFSPDGSTLATGSSAGVHVWPVNRLRNLDQCPELEVH